MSTIDQKVAALEKNVKSLQDEIKNREGETIKLVNVAFNGIGIVGGTHINTYIHKYTDTYINERIKANNIHIEKLYAGKLKATNIYIEKLYAGKLKAANIQIATLVTKQIKEVEKLVDNSRKSVMDHVKAIEKRIEPS